MNSAPSRTQARFALTVRQGECGPEQSGNDGRQRKGQRKRGRLRLIEGDSKGDAECGAHEQHHASQQKKQQMKIHSFPALTNKISLSILLSLGGFFYASRGFSLKIPAGAVDRPLNACKAKTPASEETGVRMEMGRSVGKKLRREIAVTGIRQQHNDVLALVFRALCELYGSRESGTG